jgi:hypothetical protein
MFHFDVAILTFLLPSIKTVQVLPSCCSFSHFNMLAHQFLSPTFSVSLFC